MENNILISTITPCFKMKKYLRKFLDELPNQTMFQNMEVILDHNEPDKEEIDWVKAFQIRHPGKIKHIIVKKVDPIGTSMNRCIKEATGEYVTIWNVDDLRTPNSIELQYNLLNSNPDYGIAYGNYIIVKNFGTTTGRLVEHSQIPETEHTRSMITGPFIFFRKSLTNIAGYFDEQLIQGPDFDLSVRLAFHTKAVMTREILGYYLNEGKGMSTKPNSPQPIERVLIELRYGIYDKIDYDYVADISKYSIPFIKEFGVWSPIEKYVPNYKELLLNRNRLWKKKGLIKYILSKIFFIKSIKKNTKSVIKKIIQNKNDRIK